MPLEIDNNLDIDDVVAHKLTATQIQCAFLDAYGKYKPKQIQKLLKICQATFYQWRKLPYFQILVQHIRLIELYKNLDEYTELQKASLIATRKLIEAGLSKNDLRSLEHACENLKQVMKIFGK